MTRFYVTMTWDDWPEGGSFGTVVEAADHSEAERLCKQEMAEHRADDNNPEWNTAFYLENYADEWETVDCFDLDEFIERHSEEKQAA